MQFRSSQICTLEKPIWAKAMCITSLAVRTTSAVAMIVSIHFVNHIALMNFGVAEDRQCECLSGTG